MRPNSLKKIESIPFTKEIEDSLREKLSKYCEKRNLYCISSRTIGSPYRALYLNAPNAKLLLVNPVIKKYGEDRINSQEVSEYDNNSKKARTVIRATDIEVECDNLGTVIFSGDLKEKTEELNECIMVQQMIDLLDGFTIADRNINTPITNKVKYDRNQLVLARNPEGVIEHIKYKYVQKYIDKGYVVI
jgi:peptide deformylase